ncbi:MAG: hypothetical protein WC303_03375 [Candidatus Paceibacterota bacterium]|jgi:pimeloyl-ACP methyl ester carboxylesterase
MEKKIFIIPGFKQKISDTQFTWLKSFLKNKGFDVAMVPITWNYRTMNDYIAQFEKFYKENKSNINYVLGFSYGAVIAFITAADLKPKKIYLCSLSPDFREDLTSMKEWIIKYIGKKRIEDLKRRSAKDIAKKLNVPATIFYGEKEGKRFPDLKNRCEETVRLAKNTKLIIVKNSPHDISNPEYVLAIKKEFNNF